MTSKTLSPPSIGSATLRADGAAKVSGTEKYALDLYSEGGLWAGVKRAGVPHARLKGIFTESACKVPGVRSIITHADIKGENRQGVVQKDQPVLVDDIIRHRGDAVALVVAESLSSLESALGLVTIDFEPLPGIFDIDSALLIEPELLIRENAEGKVISIVAKTVKGDVIGHSSLYNSAPCKNVFEGGAGLVHTAYRGGKGVLTQMVIHGFKATITSGVEQVFGETVSNHPFSQKLSHGQGFVTRAMEINLMPADAYAKEESAKSRVTTLMDFRTLVSSPCDVYVPKAYDEIFSIFYKDMDDDRRFLPSDETLPASQSTKCSTTIFDFAQVARLSIEETGDDFMEVISKEEEKLISQGIRVIQIWLSTGVPYVGEAVDILRKSSYFFCGVLPRWFDNDGLLMERIFDAPDWDAMVLHLDRAKELAQIIRSDWERAEGL